MNVRRRLSRPLYESLPWVYFGAGAAVLLVSYLRIFGALSLVLELPGWLAVLAGAVVWLRRRGYRRLRTEYNAPDALDQATGVSARSDARSSAPTFR